jgi:hypothetical protein
MTKVGAKAAWDRRFGLVFMAALGVAITHRTLALLAMKRIATAAHGYGDAELLAAGGDPMLEFVLDRQAALLDALGAAGLWILAGRIPAFLAAFLLWLTAFSLATSERGAPVTERRLRVGWALLVSAAISVSSTVVLGALGWVFLRLARELLRTSGGYLPAYLMATAAALGLVWVVCDVWFELLRLCVAGGRLRPLAAIRSASRAWKGHLLALSATRLALSTLTIAVSLMAVVLLPAVTGSGSAERWWATVAIDLGLFGAICVRAAWLTWASAHVPPDLGPAPTPATFEDAAPDAAPALPADPSPDPGA